MSQIDRQWVEGDSNSSTAVFDAFYARAKALEAESHTLCVLATSSEYRPHAPSTSSVTAVTFLCGCSHPAFNITRDSGNTEQRGTGRSKLELSNTCGSRRITLQRTETHFSAADAPKSFVSFAVWESIRVPQLH